MNLLDLAHFDECTDRELLVKTIQEEPEMLAQNESFRQVLIGIIEGTIPIEKSPKCQKYKERNNRAMQIICFYKGLGLGVWTKDKEFTAAGFAYKQIVAEGLMVDKLTGTIGVKDGKSLWRSVKATNALKIYGCAEYKNGLAMRLFNNDSAPKNMEDLTKLNDEWINASQEQRDKFIDMAYDK